MKYVTDDGKYFDKLNDALDHEKNYKKKMDYRKKRYDEIAKSYNDYIALRDKYTEELNKKYDEYLDLKRSYENDYKKNTEANSDAELSIYNMLHSLL